METLLKLLPYLRLLVELGAAVVQAANDGEGTRTVDEILAGRQLDMDKIRELEAEARDHYDDA